MPLQTKSIKTQSGKSISNQVICNVQILDCCPRASLCPARWLITILQCPYLANVHMRSCWILVWKEQRNVQIHVQSFIQRRGHKQAWFSKQQTDMTSVGLRSANSIQQGKAKRDIQIRGWHRSGFLNIPSHSHKKNLVPSQSHEKNGGKSRPVLLPEEWLPFPHAPVLLFFLAEICQLQ